MADPNWLAELIDHEIEAHWDDARQIVQHARADFPDADPDELAGSVISVKARIAAFVGAGTGALQSIPGVGQALALGSLVPEALFLAKLQIDVALVVAILYRGHLTKSEARALIMTCLVLALGADFIKNELRLAAVRVTAALVERALQMLGEAGLRRVLGQVGLVAAQRGILKRVPLISIPLNAVMNYGQIEAFGWAAKGLLSPSFVMCGGCGSHTGRLNRFCPSCGADLGDFDEGLSP